MGMGRDPRAPSRVKGCLWLKRDSSLFDLPGNTMGFALNSGCVFVVKGT